MLINEFVSQHPAITASVVLIFTTILAYLSERIFENYLEKRRKSSEK